MCAGTHRIADDLGEPGGDGWLTCAGGADAEVLEGLARRLEAEALMDEIDERHALPPQ